MSNIGSSSGPAFQSQYGATHGSLLKDPTRAIQRRKTEEELKVELEQETAKRIYMERLLERACQELKRYQERFGHHFQLKELDDNIQDANHPLRKEFNFELLEPLLLSYEENIHELNQLVSNYSREVSDLEARATKLVEENQTFRKELEKKCEMILSMYKSGEPSSANVYTRIIQEDIKERVDLLTEENHTLIISYKELQGKYRENKGERDLAQQKFTDQSKKLDELIKQHTMQTQELESVQIKYDSLMQESGKMMQKQTKVSTLAQKLETDASKLEKECKMYKQKTQQLSKDLDDSQRKYLAQIEQLEQEKRRLELRGKDLEVEVDTLKGQLKRSEDDNDRLQREAQKSRQDLEASKRLNMEDERKMKVYVGREELHVKSQSNLQQQLQETALERDSAQVNVKQLEASLHNINRKHDDEVHQLKQQTDKMVETVRNKARKLLEQRDDQVEELSAQCTGLQVDLERSEKENHKAKQDILQLEHEVRNQRNKFLTENEYLKNRVVELEDQVDRRERFHEDKYAGVMLDKQALDNQNRTHQMTINDLKASSEQLRKRAMQFERLNVDLKEKLDRQFKERHELQS